MIYAHGNNARGNLVRGSLQVMNSCAYTYYVTCSLIELHANMTLLYCVLMDSVVGNFSLLRYKIFYVDTRPRGDGAFEWQWMTVHIFQFSDSSASKKEAYAYFIKPLAISSVAAPFEGGDISNAVRTMATERYSVPSARSDPVNGASFQYKLC